ncbi:hypothetical protein, partial [Paraburkholderia caribensis]|uniref:hypothetical protein n=1 Tax=Paraburkholderia caribensis TaxID=75105 RepID=UPI001C634F1A
QPARAYLNVFVIGSMTASTRSAPSRACMRDRDRDDRQAPFERGVPYPGRDGNIDRTSHTEQGEISWLRAAIA